MSELATREELYTPCVNDMGVYIDHIPQFTKGIRCPCNARKDKVFLTTQSFQIHTKSKQHTKWLETLNNNRSNYFLECMHLKETVQTQQQIIARLERELRNKSNTIDYLTMQLHKPSPPITLASYDLLDMVID
jgi:hypothetical protein